MMDLNFLSRSKLRRDLLALFFTDPGQEHYLRELSRLLGCSAGSLRRELLSLQKNGLFATTRKGNLLYYSVNQKHELYSELKSIVSKTIGVEGALRDALRDLPGVKTAFIYGSYAAHAEKTGSDIDLMVIGDPPASALNRTVAGLEMRLKREIHPAVYTEQEYRKKKKARSGFITDLLKRPRMMLVGEPDGL